jgi:hypothetical protein
MHVFNLFVVLRYALIICVFETCSEPIAELQTSSPYFVEENSFTLYIPFICTYDVRTNRTQWLSTATGYNLNYQKLEIVDVGEFVDLSGTQSSKTFAIVLQHQTDASLDRECHACNDFIVNVKCADSDAPDGGNTATVNIQVSGVFEAPVLQPSRFPTISTSELSVVAGATIGTLKLFPGADGIVPSYDGLYFQCRSGYADDNWGYGYTSACGGGIRAFRLCKFPF